ncbi:MAG: AMIN domain-containing protein [Candidatus Rokubacteria bacterium]|nr:AMIN domain-containing protein [Candidatus Rokubacteria bacterium]
MRSWVAGFVLGLGALTLDPTQGVSAPAVVTGILAGTEDGRLQVEIRGSEPLNYLLVEGTDPFSVSLLFLNATFGFPSEEREFPGPGLKKIRTAILKREGSRLGRLDLTFGERAPYRLTKDGTRLILRVEAPAPPGGFVLSAGAGRGGDSPGDRPAPPAVPQILKLTPEILGEEVRVIVEASGPLAYKSFVMEKPFRVVVDFEGAQFRRLEDTVEVRNVLLRRIRSSQFTPTAVRVVLDLARPNPFWIEARAAGAVIHLGPAPRP